MVSLQAALEELLQAHGLNTNRYADWVLVDNAMPAIGASIVRERKTENGFIVQLDVEVAIGEDQVIVESFGGMGVDKEEATANAFKNFVTNDFHVLLAAFWDDAHDHQVEIDQWEIHGLRWRVIIGPYGIRSAGGLDEPEDLVVLVDSLIRQEPLDEDLYWIRTFYSNMNAEQTIAEALLNNEVWETAQEAISKLPWPPSDTFYSVRHFLIMQRKPSLSTRTSQPPVSGLEVILPRNGNGM